MFNTSRLVRDSLRHHRRIHAAVALGVAVTTAVLVGALVVGDSVRGSLQDMALRRLGPIDEVLVTDKFFGTDLAARLNSLEEGNPPGFRAGEAIVLPGSLTAPDKKTYAADVTFYGVSRLQNYLSLDQAEDADPKQRTSIVDEKGDEVAINRPLADELGVEVGDEIIIRLPSIQQAPSESALGRKTETVASSSRLKVTRILPTDGIGALSLRPTQAVPKNVFLRIEILQQVLKKPGRANAVFARSSSIAGSDHRTQHEAELERTHAALQKKLSPTLADYGLKWTQAKPGYFSLTSERMLFEPNYEAAALAAYKDLAPQPVLTYLANTIAAGSGDAAKEIPYSTIAALDIVARPTLGPFTSPDGAKIERIADDEIVLTQWAADDLGAKIGDTITLKYFEPESTHADVKEATATLRLAAIAELKPDDPLITQDLTPELPGVTDQLSIRPKRDARGNRSEGWNPPFPYDADRIRQADEDYWDQYRATPKAFVSLATGRRLWSSRFGDVTSLRVAPRDGLSVESLDAMFRPDPASLGFAFQPVKLHALAASSGTTPFEGLFLGFSFFIIAAAVLLTVLLFRLGVEQRATEAGVMLAVGLGAKRVARLFLVEGAIVAALGSVVGVALGVGYAWLMLYLLRTLWFDAVRTTSLDLFVLPTTVAGGYFGGLLISVVALWWSLRMLRRINVRRLLAGQAAESDATLTPGGSSGAKGWNRGTVTAVVCLLAAGGLGVVAMQLTDMAQAGAFFGAAALVLTALVLLVRRALSAAKFGSLVSQGSGRVATLALRNAGRNPGRSTLTIALVASAAFLIVSVSAFRLAPPDTYLKKTSGTGGFALLARSDLSILPSLNDDEGRIDLNFSQAQRRQLATTTTFPLRVKPGDDSSCLNLYQTSRPTVLGVSEDFIRRGGFDWAGSEAATDADRANPWLLLATTPTAGAAVPVVIDQATAQYGLHLGGVGTEFDLDVGDGRPALRCRIVGLLRNSILQGSVITGESWFKQSFPDVAGYRMFLVEAEPTQVASLQSMLEDVLSDFGFDAENTQAILANYLAVQNTYLSTFQTLGGLGLLLGTLGVAIAQLRSVLERRSELALMRAVGLSQSLMSRMVLGENLVLLVAGLLCGVGAALIAVLPHALGGGAGVPWVWLAVTLGAVLVAGLIAGAVTVRAVLRMPLLGSLRGD